MVAAFICPPCCRGGFFLLAILLAPALLAQETLVTVTPRASIDELAADPQWLRLLHHDISENEGTFLAQEFYLSPQGRDRPRAELRATLQAMEMPVTDDTHPRCRFPARYLWLGKQLGQPAWQAIPAACRQLRKWLAENPLRSISLLLVSGYMGNPASLFGHSLLKLDTDTEEHDLFSTTINYGALVPPKEPVIVYIFRGLLGGYQAGYSDRYFYTQDVVYSHTEARDIWEYELDLSPEQVRFLQLHLWEIIGRKKQYFFLTRNCAYELGRVIDVVLQRPLTRSARVWYTPSELFDRLHDIDQAAKTRQGKSIIRQLRYHPSAERLLIRDYENLDSALKSRARRFLKQPESSQIDAVLAGLSAAEQQLLLDFLFSYQHFIFIKEQPQPSPETLSLKHALLLKRLTLPPSVATNAQPLYRPSPSEGQKPSIIGLGIVAKKNRGSVPLLKLTAFSQEPTGQNALDGGELTVLDLRFGLPENGMLIEQIDYFRILHHALSSLPMASPWSWRLLLRSARNPGEGYDHQFYLGMGRSAKTGKALFYSLLTPSLHSLAPIFRLRPEAGLILPLGDNLRAHLNLGLENSTTGWQVIALGVLQHSLSRNLSLQLEYQKEKQSSWLLSMRSHW